MKNNQKNLNNDREDAGGMDSIFISAGEPSGDMAGAHLIRAIHKISSAAPLKFIGIGGSRMMQAGLRSLFPMSELSIMGLVEILPRIWKLRKRLTQTHEYIATQQPGVIVTIDSPGFHFSLAKRLKKDARTQHIPIVHYVAPSVWAWRAGRAKRIPQFLDHLLTLFPFEPPYFEKHGLATTCVGHFATERDIEPHQSSSDEDFRRKHALVADTPILCILPGSRVREVRTLLPIFLDAAKILQKSNPDLDVVIPTLEHLKPIVEQISVGRSSFSNAKGQGPRILVGDEAKWACFEHSRAALAASGTVTLELAQAGTPTVVAYRVNPLTAWVLRKFLTVPFVCLVNIIMKRRVIPELLQERCCPECLAEVMNYVLNDQPTRSVQQEAFAKVGKLIRQPGGHAPSETAAKLVLSYLSKTAGKNLGKPKGARQRI